MLAAYLHGKLGRVVGDGGANAETPDDGHDHGASGWRARLLASEDVLTASVFERLSYLEPEGAWRVLGDAVQPLGVERWSARVPPGEPRWHFWPTLRHASVEKAGNRVEPDVVVRWSDVVLVIEAKHRGEQRADQWVRELRAVRADSRFIAPRLLFVAAGGTAPERHEALAAEARGILEGTEAALFSLEWRALLRAVRLAQRRVSAAGERAILSDLVAVLAAWGYRAHAPIGTLPHVPISPVAIRALPRTVRPRRARAVASRTR